MSFLKAIEEGKLAKKKKSLQRTEENITKNNSKSSKEKNNLAKTDQSLQDLDDELERGDPWKFTEQDIVLKDEKLAELEKEIQTWKTRFQEMKYSKEAIQKTLNQTKLTITNKSPSEYVEQLKYDSSDTELVKQLRKILFHSKHTGQTFNRNQRRAQAIFKDAMEWRNLL